MNPGKAHDIGGRFQGSLFQRTSKFLKSWMGKTMIEMAGSPVDKPRSETEPGLWPSKGFSSINIQKEKKIKFAHPSFTSQKLCLIPEP